MPELPEVETMVRGLRPAMVGRRVASATVHDPFLLDGVSAREFEGMCRVRSRTGWSVGASGSYLVLGDRRG